MYFTDLEMIEYCQKCVAEIASLQKLKLSEKSCQILYTKKMISYGLCTVWDCYDNIKIKLWSRISISGSILESKDMCAVFQKKGQKKGKMFENLDKNIQNLKIFWKRAASYMHLLHAWN